ncbi:S41 family peptidase [Chryseobacterium culicis]|uniref:Carbohydrate binding domain-containing protein n=1 Tax=Chryseobacterium culicis TaxID=680127 RepID=A0A1H6HA15_CHRCI|nr:S41 family peptidase [Chryseobacterium culicis]SEH32326.1 Carbohydrate binding domain-containing protein [Chryseobacterium culicis]
MKKLTYTIVAAFLFCSVEAQIQNAGFENMTDGLPNHWNVKKTDSYEGKIDYTHYFGGKASMQLTGKTDQSKEFQSFSQKVSLDIQQLQKIEISAYVKSENTNGKINLWTQVKDENGEMIDFGNSESQQRPIAVNKDWTKYSLTFTADKNVKSLLLGGVLSGNGTVWFDHFELNKIPFSNEEPSKKAAKYIQDFKNIVKKNSIFSDKLDWQNIETNLHNLSKGMKTIDDTTPALSYIIQNLRQAGDNHSFISGKERSEKQKSGNIYETKPDSRLIDQNIGYISVPAFGSLNKEVGNDFALQIHNMIKKLDSENTIKGWIVDLRSNTGGNMEPMIGGLGSLIGEGTLGYFVYKDQKTPWIYKNRQFGATKITEPYDLKSGNSKIAVLIGPHTASSGEATTIAFIGKSNVKLFGQPSAGYTSANSIYPLSDGKIFAVASSYEMDRNGKVYSGKIDPDITVASKEGQDMDIETAKHWILSEQQTYPQ